MKNKTLKEYGDELEASIDRYNKLRDTVVVALSSWKHCPVCHKRIISKHDLEALEKLGECLRCDHVRTAT